jgi:hypothetical protein
MALTQCGHCFQSFVLLRAEVSGTPTLNIHPRQRFSGPCSHSSTTTIQISLLLKHKVLRILFVHHWSIIQNFSMLHILLFCMAAFSIYQTLGDISSTMHTLLKYSK